MDRHDELLDSDSSAPGIDIINISIDIRKKKNNALIPMMSIVSSVGMQAVVSIGNRGGWKRSRIADYGLSVGTTDTSGSPWPKSSYLPDLVAPGVGIRCEQPLIADLGFHPHGAYNGTSFSTAMVSASLAVLLSTTNATNEDCRNAVLGAALRRLWPCVNAIVALGGGRWTLRRPTKFSIEVREHR